MSSELQSTTYLSKDSFTSPQTTSESPRENSHADNDPMSLESRVSLLEKRLVEMDDDETIAEVEQKRVQESRERMLLMEEISGELSQESKMKLQRIILEELSTLEGRLLSPSDTENPFPISVLFALAYTSFGLLGKSGDALLISVPFWIYAANQWQKSKEVKKTTKKVDENLRIQIGRLKTTLAPDIFQGENPPTQDSESQLKEQKS